MLICFESSYENRSEKNQKLYKRLYLIFMTTLTCILKFKDNYQYLLSRDEICVTKLLAWGTRGRVINGLEKIGGKWRRKSSFMMYRLFFFDNDWWRWPWRQMSLKFWWCSNDNLGININHAALWRGIIKWNSEYIAASL